MKLTLPILAGLLVVAPLGAQSIKINLDPNKPADTAPAAKPAAPAAAPAAETPAPKQELIVPADGKYADVQKFELYGYLLARRLNVPEQVVPLLKSQDELLGFLRGIGAAMTGSDLPYDGKLLVPQTQEMIKARGDAATAQNEKLRAELNEKNSKEAKDFLATLDSKAGVKKTASGLRYEILVDGKGPKAKAEQAVRTHFKTTFINGDLLSTSKDKEGKENDVEMSLVTAVPGLKEGLQLVGVGGKVKLYIPAELTYGDKSMFPGALMIFEIEILEVKEPAKQPEEKK